MTKLPQHPVGFGTSSQRLNTQDHEPANKPALPQVHHLEIDRTDGGGENRHGSIWPDTEAPDLSIEASLEVDDIDAVSRVSLNERRVPIAEIDPRAALASLYGRNLATGLLSFVTPRLRDPDVLRAEKHGVLLERLADRLWAGAENSVAREGIDALQQELRRLILLRQNQNSLIKG
ncbi:hypothetical protein AAFX91_31430 [Bradyrhizobium sp. 31Argb]|uniref:hypothetical protein n=1 Tax=Bradyrhizobium TaxID=374 RepID=UPI00041154C0|nr:MULTISPECIES: hypothetical protein [Bradyrhizobium]RZN15591.1 hypothetical protein CWO90_41410 [Bradyrhizobium sp. Leo121]TAI61422.1 hypothetical protein CWO89_35245 [Bradyrhizobium sp. Leo170]